MIGLALAALLSLDALAIEHCAPLRSLRSERALVIVGDEVKRPKVHRHESRGVVYMRMVVPKSARALCHSHPVDGGSILPGPRDWEVVRMDRPSYIAHDGRLIVLELDKTGYKARPVYGRITGKELRALKAAADEQNYKAGYTK